VVQAAAALGAVVALAYTARTYRLAHRGQLTERFSNALERLGSEEPYVRLGGVHALAHVLRESDDHHLDVVEVLAAFVRQRTPRVLGPAHATADGADTRSGVLLVAPDQALPAEPAPDVQAALTALGRRPRRPESEGILNLRALHLAGARLAEANLASAVLVEANLTGAGLQRANLTGAGLWQANLTRAWLWRANLTDAQLGGEPDRRGALAGEPDRRGSPGANLTGAESLTQAQLDAAYGDAATRLPAGLQPPASWTATQEATAPVGVEGGEDEGAAPGPARRPDAGEDPPALPAGRPG
jgi:hypothetical protein